MSCPLTNAETTTLLEVSVNALTQSAIEDILRSLETKSMVHNIDNQWFLTDRGRRKIEEIDP